MPRFREMTGPRGRGSKITCKAGPTAGILLCLFLFLPASLLSTTACSKSSRASRGLKRLDPNDLDTRAESLQGLFDTSPLQLASQRGGLRFEATVTLSRHASHGQDDVTAQAADEAAGPTNKDLGPIDPVSPVRITEKTLLEINEKGLVHGRQYNNREYGYEFVWTSPKLYFHLRYRPYMYWKAERAEAIRHIDRIWSTPADVWHLLAPCMSLRKEPDRGNETRAEKATHYSLHLVPGHPAGPADGWQRRASCLRIKGEMDVTPGPLVTLLRIDASLRLAPAPNETNKQAPDRILDIAYRQEVTPGPSDLHVEAPKGAVEAPLRNRPELDRLKLLGRRPKPGWYRGGGPVRWWRKHRGGKTSRPAGRRSRRP